MFRAFLHGERIAKLCSMSAYLKSALLAVLIVAGLGVATPVSALTLEEVVGLSKSGVTDAVILALIDRDKTIFALEPDQIVKLQRDGVSEPIILALLKSGRAEGDEAARADAENSAAFIASRLAPGPDLVIVGHGPERPNVPVHSFYASPPIPLIVGAPYFAPYVDPSFGYRGTRSYGSRHSNEPRALCYAETHTARSTRPLTYVTECPAVMQQRRIR
jgi:hypothetical protein